MHSELPVLAVELTGDPVQLVCETTAAGIRPETELLLCCARTRMDAATAERIKALLRQRIDWVYLIRTAILHGMPPLLYWNLRSTCPEAVPTDTMGQLQKFFYANKLRNVFLTQELLKLLTLLKGQEIPAIPFKGPALAASLYGNLGLREFSDLDILVRRRDVLRARDLLLSQEYHLFRPVAEAKQSAFLRSGSAYTMIRENPRVTVDLHWRFTRRSFPFPLSFDHLHERLEPVDLAGEKVFSLAPEDLLLVLCMHGSKHLWMRLEWICGVAELVRARPELDWGRVMEQANELGSERMLFLGLVLASSLLGADLPEGVRGRIDADRTARSLAKRVRERLFSEAAPHVMEWWGFRCKVRERWRDRWPLFLDFVSTLITPTARDRAILPLPRSLALLHYLIRPIRLVGEYILASLGRSFIRKTHAN